MRTIFNHEMAMSPIAIFTNFPAIASPNVLFFEQINRNTSKEYSQATDLDGFTYTNNTLIEMEYNRFYTTSNQIGEEYILSPIIIENLPPK